MKTGRIILACTTALLVAGMIFADVIAIFPTAANAASDAGPAVAGDATKLVLPIPLVAGVVTTLLLMLITAVGGAVLFGWSVSRGLDNAIGEHLAKLNINGRMAAVESEVSDVGKQIREIAASLRMLSESHARINPPPTATDALLAELLKEIKSRQIE